MHNTKIQHISCVIIAKNAASTLTNTLDSLACFDEVVLYNNNSTDSTQDIAISYPNVKLIQGEFIGFGPSKNKAAGFSKNDWIISLDADEILSDDFIQNLQQTKLNELCIYTILRENYYQSAKIKYCWGKDIIPRLYNRNKTAFTDKNVHEAIIEDGFHIKHIKGAIKHYPYGTISDFIIKLDRYSTLYAEDNAGKKSTSPLKAIINAHFAFFKTYVLKLGFLDGYPGLIIAFSHMATTFYKHMKLYAMNKSLKQ
ncbi:glycosyl transferase [Methyloprofundus sedimenti]|uniref:Glycosyl transferase n=1 Tax=Methyloprofundus sedimenti TaxID=1420851 RepID=A0A1V8M543_9GAMM|nr:glycosyltransferase family 2 protein [Methyloprofundus sedimenti]OQK16606.1 glycosyl transferase [Methyloprofundus sedimenti]